MSAGSRVSRRAILGGAAATFSLGLLGCDRVLSALAGDALPARIDPPGGTEIDAYHHLLQRVGFGPWPGQIDEARKMGREAYVDAQLDPGSIEDRGCGLRAEVIDSVNLPTPLLFDVPPEELEVELRRHTLLRAIYSKRQLFEVMVEFWSDHFNIAIGKSLCRQLKVVDDREVIRDHALGTFRDLLGASALSPAMLVYLDGRENKGGGPSDRPNENYARELMELHTLGVHGGYTQDDVMNAARCLTGFVVREEWAPGMVEFVPERHDQGEKRVLGHTFAAGGGREDVEKLLDVVADHPSTARFVSRKLASAFVADDPPQSVVDRASDTFTATRGDIKKVVRSILLSDELDAARGAKIKRPFRLVVSALRALAADTHAKGDVVEHLGRMGQPLFSYPTPDGYPSRGDAWLGTMLWRWSFGLALGEGRVEGVGVDLPRLEKALGGERSAEKLARHLLGRAPTREELAAVDGYEGESDRAKKLALLLASPGFQRY